MTPLPRALLGLLLLSAPLLQAATDPLQLDQTANSDLEQISPNQGEIRADFSAEIARGSAGVERVDTDCQRFDGFVATKLGGSRSHTTAVPTPRVPGANRERGVPTPGGAPRLDHRVHS